MKEQLVSFDTAKLAKEKDFYWKTLGYYESNTKIYRNSFIFKNWSNRLTGSEHIHRVVYGYDVDEYINAPTQSLLQKWLREEHKISISLFHLEKWSDDGNSCYCVFDYDIKNIGNGVNHISKLPMEFNTYEEALEKGLYQALKLIKI